MGGGKVNLFRQFEKLLPARPLLIGTVQAASADGLMVELMSGAQVRARGEAAVGERVFVRDGAVEGPPPAMPVIYVEV